MGFTLILFNMKLFTRHYSVTSKDIQSQEKCRFLKKSYQSKFKCNVIMVAETFTIFVTQLVTFKGPCSHKQIHVKKQETLYIFCMFKMNCIVSDLFSTKKKNIS